MRSLQEVRYVLIITAFKMYCSSSRGSGDGCHVVVAVELGVAMIMFACLLTQNIIITSN